jgi:NitT/TauT family transport system substrate-binding protein
MDLMRIHGWFAMRALCLLALLTAIAVSACGDDSDSEEAAAGQSSGNAPAELEDVSLRLDWIVDGAATCYYAALDNGYFEDEGLNVEIKEGKGSGLSLTLIGNESDDFAVADFGAMAQTLAKGVDAKMVMGIFQKSPHTIISMKDSGIEGPEDLVGKKVGASPGESPLQLLPAYLATNGVDPSEVEVVNLDPGAKLPALYAGRVDAIVAFATAELPIAETQRPGELNVQYYGDFGVSGLSSGIIVNPNTIEERPEVVTKFVAGLQKGYELCRDDPEAAVDNLVEQFPDAVTRDQALAATDIVVGLLHTENSEGEPIGAINATDAEETLATLEKYGDLPEVEPLDTYYTDQFAN